jgi:MFS family permease
MIATRISPGRIEAATAGRDRLQRSFALLMAAQFVSALADNAVLIVAIAMLEDRGSPIWLAPLLKLLFTLSYVLFAFAVGRIADAHPKARVMMAANALKAGGCVLLLAGMHPLPAYALIGLGAALYSPAKYGLMVELLPAPLLVRGNAWLEGLTIASVILGALCGGFLVSPEFESLLFAMPFDAGDAAWAGAAAVLALYALAAAINLLLPRLMPASPAAGTPTLPPLAHFRHDLRVLASDPRGGMSLAVTTLLWGVGAAMQFVALDWGREVLGLGLDRSSILQGVVAFGVALGAVAAARSITLDRTERILPLGVAFGPLLLLMLPVQTLAPACVMLALAGAFAGFFVVPMNALLQHRGYALVNSGQSIAVQNFCENLSVIAMLGLYAGTRAAGIALPWVVAGFALLVSLLMALIVWRHRRAARKERA